MPKSKDKRNKTTESSPFARQKSSGGYGGTIIAAILIAGGLAAWWSSSSQNAGSVAVQVNLPSTLSAPARQGQAAFNRTCASCHGENAAGGTGGPPLIHKIYEPGHHADGAIRNAVMLGVRQHHWGFGNMPPQETVSGADIDAIIAFVRETQRANGIR